MVEIQLFIMEPSTRARYLSLLCYFFILHTIGVSSQVTCTFNSGWCGFTQRYDDDFDWTRDRYSTYTSYTGPSYDHTYGYRSSRGYYIYINARYRSYQDKARLVSPQVSTKVGQYFHNCTAQFWYHMYGSGIGTLNVYVRPTYGQLTEAHWSMSGNQQDTWHLGYFSFIWSSSNFQVIFEGIRGSNDRGDIALDDIELQCDVEPDLTPPEVSGCPSNIQTTTELGTLGTIVTWIEPSATDQADTLEILRSHEPSTMFLIGSTMVAYIFRDPYLNNAACTFTVTVEVVDTTPPTITDCTNDIETTTELGTNGTTVFWNEPNVTDLSGTPQRTRTHAPSMAFPLGLTWVTYEFTDTSNNTANCTFSVNVETVDTTPPVISQCPVSFDYVSGRHVIWTEPTAFDISGNITEYRSHSPGMLLTKKTLVFYSFTDSSDHVVYCNFTINVVYDMTPPSIFGCPTDINASAEISDLEVPVYWAEPFAFDDYERVMLVYFNRFPGEIFPIGSSIVEYIFADDSYNLANCTFSVTVEHVDTTPPKIHSCPSDITKVIELGTPSIPVYWSPPSATDESSNASLMSQSHFPGDQFAAGTTNVRYTFSDGSGNEGSCTFSIILREVDTIAPTIINCPDDILTNEISSIGTVLTWIEPSAVDASDNVTLLAKTRSPGESFYPGYTNVLYFFSDSSNNLALCSFYIYVNSANNSYFEVDSIPPVIVNCPSNIHQSSELGQLGVKISWSVPSAFNQHGEFALIYATHQPGAAFLVGSTTNVSYIFSDGSNRVSCNFSVTVTQVDTTPPLIDYCPDDITEAVEIGITTTTVSWTEPEASDLSGNVSLSPKSRIPRVFSPLRDTTVRYVFMDESGNKAICEFVVSFNLVDSTPPSITGCPSDIDATTEVGTSVTRVSWSYPSATDLSGSVRISSSHIPGQEFPLGMSIVLYQFEDQSFNQAQCNFTVNVTNVDTKPPEITFCPDDISKTIELGDTHLQVSWSVPLAFDNSGNTTLVSQSHFPSDNFTVGKTKVNYTFVDGSGNGASCIFGVTITPVDTMAPQILFCPSDIITLREVGSTVTFVSWREPNVIDASGNVTLLVQTHSPGNWFAIGVTSVMYLYTDPSDNIAACSFTIKAEVVDTKSPEITFCPEDITDTIELGEMHQNVSWSTPTASDISNNVSLMSQSHSSGDYFPVGKTEVKYMFVDGSGNGASCTFYVEISPVDTKAPEILNCPSDFTTVIEVGSVVTSALWREPSAVDASGNVSLLAQTHSSGDLFGIGLTSVMYLYMDPSSNIASCSFKITIDTVDTLPPNIINCPSNIYVSAEVGQSGIAVTWNVPFATDHSGMVSSNSSHASGQVFLAGSTNVVYNFEDKYRNRAECSFTVHVVQVDTVPPEVTFCPDDIAETIELGMEHKSVSWLEPLTVDISGNVSLMSQSHNSGDYFPAASKTKVNYVFIDGSGNRAQCSFCVTLKQVDTKSPTILSCPSDITTSVEVGSMTTSVSWIEPSVVDASDNVTLMLQTHISGDVFGVGSTTVMYLFADMSNNIAACTFVIRANTVDTISPTILGCPSDKRASVEVGSSQIPINWNEPSATDESGRVFLRRSTHKSGQLFSVGMTTVSYLFMDNANNIAFCNFSVTVDQVDTIPPIITSCPADINKIVELGDNERSISWHEPSASDKSGHVTLLHYTYKSGDVFDVGSTPISYTFIDRSNNSATCDFTVTVTETDTTAPTILYCPLNIKTDVELGSLGSIIDWDEPKAQDTSGNVMLLIQTHLPGTFFSVGITIVTYIFSDYSNNLEKCSFTISVTAVETANPLISSCPSNIITSVEPGENETTVTWKEPFAVNASVTTKISSSHMPNDSFPLGSTQVIYTFGDESGKQMVCSFTVVMTETNVRSSVIGKSTGNEGKIGISVAGLVLSLLIIVIGGGLMMLFIYIRKNQRRADSEMDQLGMSITSSDTRATTT